jgi:hypothetical protein
MDNSNEEIQPSTEERKRMYIYCVILNFLIFAFRIREMVLDAERVGANKNKTIHPVDDIFRPSDPQMKEVRKQRRFYKRIKKNTISPIQSADCYWRFRWLVVVNIYL